MIDNKRLYGFIGLAMKAGKLSVGDSRATEALRSGGGKLLLISSDASENTKHKFYNMCKFRDIPIVHLPNRIEFGKIIGRSFAVMAAVCDDGFAKQIEKIAEGTD